MSIKRVRVLTQRGIDTGAMHIVVGDAATQLPRMRELGYGEPALVNARLEVSDR